MEPVTAAKTPLDRVGQGSWGERPSSACWSLSAFQGSLQIEQEVYVSLSPHRWKVLRETFTGQLCYELSVWLIYLLHFHFFLAPGPVSSPPSLSSLLPPVEIIFFSLLVFFSLFARGHECYFPSNHSVLHTSTALLPHPQHPVASPSFFLAWIPHALDRSGHMWALVSPGLCGQWLSLAFLVAQVSWRNSYLLPTDEETEKYQPLLQLNLKNDQNPKNKKDKNKTTKWWVKDLNKHFTKIHK